MFREDFEHRCQILEDELGEYRAGHDPRLRDWKRLAIGLAIVGLAFGFVFGGLMQANCAPRPVILVLDPVSPDSINEGSFGPGQVWRTSAGSWSVQPVEGGQLGDGLIVSFSRDEANYTPVLYLGEEGWQLFASGPDLISSGNDVPLWEQHFDMLNGR